MNMVLLLASGKMPRVVFRPDTTTLYRIKCSRSVSRPAAVLYSSTLEALMGGWGRNGSKFSQCLDPTAFSD